MLSDPMKGAFILLLGGGEAGSEGIYNRYQMPLVVSRHEEQF